jgi:hypothetical protein
MDRSREEKMTNNERKSFLLRLDPIVSDMVTREARRAHMSKNAFIETFLREYLVVLQGRPLPDEVQPIRGPGRPRKQER